MTTSVMARTAFSKAIYRAILRKKLQRLDSFLIFRFLLLGKFVLSGVLIFIVLAHSLVQAGLPEPGLLLYGIISDGNTRVTSGSVQCLLQPISGGPVTTAAISLSDLSGQFSYVVQIPLEAAVDGSSVRPNAIGLTASPVVYSLSLKVNGADTRFASSGQTTESVSLSFADRGRVMRWDVGIVPQILQHPQSQVIRTGQTLRLSVSATGSPLPTYKWYRSGTLLSAFTSGELVLSNATMAAAGNYRCDVSNGISTVSSNNAIVTVVAATDAKAVNKAEMVSETIPSNAFGRQAIPFQIKMQNTSGLSWSTAQGYSLAKITDDGSMVGGTSLPISDPNQVVAANGGFYTFSGSMVAPTRSGRYILEFQMMEKGKGTFGDVVRAVIDIPSNVGEWSPYR